MKLLCECVLQLLVRSGSHHEVQRALLSWPLDSWYCSKRSFGQAWTYRLLGLTFFLTLSLWVRIALVCRLVSDFSSSVLSLQLTSVSPQQCLNSVLEKWTNRRTRRHEGCSHKALCWGFGNLSLMRKHIGSGHRFHVNKDKLPDGLQVLYQKLRTPCAQVPSAVCKVGWFQTGVFRMLFLLCHLPDGNSRESSWDIMRLNSWMPLGSGILDFVTRGWTSLRSNYATFWSKKFWEKANCYPTNFVSWTMKKSSALELVAMPMDESFTHERF